MEEGTPLPTPWNKEQYDAADEAWQIERARLKERIAALERDDAGEEAIAKAEQEFDIRDKEHGKMMYERLHSGPYAGKVGAFEGAGGAVAVPDEAFQPAGQGRAADQEWRGHDQ